MYMKDSSNIQFGQVYYTCRITTAFSVCRYPTYPADSNNIHSSDVQSVQVSGAPVGQ